MKISKTPVIYDVARVSGVSTATVSQVLNNGGRPVSAATRERVLQAAKQLNYRPSPMARGLMAKRMNSLGVVYLHSHQPIHKSASFMMMMDGVLEAATSYCQDTLMCTSYSWSDGEERLATLLDRRCDGHILVVPPTDNQVVPALQEYGAPFVLLAGQSDDPSVSSVCTNDEEEAFLLVSHLIRLGHRHIGFASSPDDDTYSYGRDRFAGYQRAHAAAGLNVDPALVLSLTGGDELIAALMDRPTEQRPTAFFGVCDDVALPIIYALQRLGFRVPDDVSVVGYDDIPASETCTPGLTTVRQPLKEIGKQCVEILLAQIEGKIPPGQKIYLPAEIVMRGSLAPPNI